MKNFPEVYRDIKRQLRDAGFSIETPLSPRHEATRTAHQERLSRVLRRKISLELVASRFRDFHCCSERMVHVEGVLLLFNEECDRRMRHLLVVLAQYFRADDPEIGATFASIPPPPPRHMIAAKLATML